MQDPISFILKRPDWLPENWRDFFAPESKNNATDLIDFFKKENSACVKSFGHTRCVDGRYKKEDCYTGGDSKDCAVARPGGDFGYVMLVDEFFSQHLEMAKKYELEACLDFIVKEVFDGELHGHTNEHGKEEDDLYGCVHCRFALHHDSIKPKLAALNKLRQEEAKEEIRLESIDYIVDDGMRDHLKKWLDAKIKNKQCKLTMLYGPHDERGVLEIASGLTSILSAWEKDGEVRQRFVYSDIEVLYILEIAVKMAGYLGLDADTVFKNLQNISNRHMKNTLMLLDVK